MLTVVTSNVNGVRAALRNGGLEQLREAQESKRADVICLQEVRATTEQLYECLDAAGFTDSHVVHDESTKLGHAGVAIISRLPLTEVRYGVGPREFAKKGRWVEALVEHPKTPFVVASIYVPTGDAEVEEKQAEKYRFLDAMTKRMRAHMTSGQEAVMVGDLNVAHRQVDLKNWKGNLKSAGFLPEERAYFDTWLDKHGWVDLHRRCFGDVEGFALRNAVSDVEEHNVAELLEAGEESQGATDLARPDQSNLVTRHEGRPLCFKRRARCMRQQGPRAGASLTLLCGRGKS